ncbi:VrrA/YqfQ family protein [Virgibacillus kekensis]|uniref:VrrA/YqfQ family protein n=1 Tax=Virgibacillus kekensis TaxID=202261 RepID=A0ABV9DG46_9BACI
MIWGAPARRPNNQVFPAGYRPERRINYQPHPRQGFLAPYKQQGFLTPDRIGSLSQKLDNLQRILKTVNSAVPIIQQYGPIVKNLPTMLQVMKALNETDHSDDASVEDDEWVGDLSDENESLLSLESSIDEESISDNRQIGESVPKLFI